MPDKVRTLHEESILVVDDDKDFLNEVRLMLVSHDVGKVVTLNDSRRVIDELERGGISVILLDWVMPHLTGSDLLPVVVERFPHGAEPLFSHDIAVGSVFKLLPVRFTVDKTVEECLSKWRRLCNVFSHKDHTSDPKE